jgi:hypothetical protein
MGIGYLNAKERLIDYWLICGWMEFPDYVASILQINFGLAYVVSILIFFAS